MENDDDWRNFQTGGGVEIVRVTLWTTPGKGNRDLEVDLQ